MSTATVKTRPMAKKTPGRRGRPAGRRPTVPIYARVDPQLASAWESYVDSLEPKTSSSAMVELLIKQHLRDKGLWPATQQTTNTPPEDA